MILGSTQLHRVVPTHLEARPTWRFLVYDEGGNTYFSSLAGAFSNLQPEGARVGLEYSDDLTLCQIGPACLYLVQLGSALHFAQCSICDLRHACVYQSRNIFASTTPTTAVILVVSADCISSRSPRGLLHGLVLPHPGPTLEG